MEELKTVPTTNVYSRGKAEGLRESIRILDGLVGQPTALEGGIDSGTAEGAKGQRSTTQEGVKEKSDAKDSGSNDTE